MWFREYNVAGGYWETGCEVRLDTIYRTADGKQLYQGMPVYDEANQSLTVAGVTSDKESIVLRSDRGILYSCDTPDIWRTLKSSRWNAEELMILELVLSRCEGNSMFLTLCILYSVFLAILTWASNIAIQFMLG